MLPSTPVNGIDYSKWLLIVVLVIISIRISVCYVFAEEPSHGRIPT